jgi:hypothetical protein
MDNVTNRNGIVYYSTAGTGFIYNLIVYNSFVCNEVDKCIFEFVVVVAPRRLPISLYLGRKRVHVVT